MNRHLILCFSLPLMMAIGACGKQPEPAKDQDQAKSSILICEQASNRIMLMDSEVDCKNESFTPLDKRHGMAKVKSISQLGKGGPILVLQATEKWYSTGPRTIDEVRIWALPKARIYKARWWLP